MEEMQGELAVLQKALEDKEFERSRLEHQAAQLRQDKEEAVKALEQRNSELEAEKEVSQQLAREVGEKEEALASAEATLKHTQLELQGKEVRELDTFALDVGAVCDALGVGTASNPRGRVLLALHTVAENARAVVHKAVSVILAPDIDREVVKTGWPKSESVEELDERAAVAEANAEELSQRLFELAVEELEVFEPTAGEEGEAGDEAELEEAAEEEPDVPGPPAQGEP